jgi:outer membrane protein assembly factor BamE (lipoprotein component of BamABCDE complex)
MRGSTVLTGKRSSAFARKALCIAGLMAMLMTLDGCFFFRSKPDPRAQDMTTQLTPGMTPEDVLMAVGPPQRRGQNLFDKRKEYWIYEFVNEQKKKKKRENGAQDNALAAELQLMFDRGKLVNWNLVSRN